MSGPLPPSRPEPSSHSSWAPARRTPPTAVASFWGDNYETREASLNNSNGTALTLRSKSGTPSLKVDRTTKVPNLNADMAIFVISR